LEVLTNAENDMTRFKNFYRKTARFFLLFTLISISHYAHAESRDEKFGPISNKGLGFLFKKDRVSMQFVGGGLWSPFLINEHRSDIDYYQANLRVGVMLTDPDKPKYFFRGNVEGIIEATYSRVHEGSGTFLYGGVFLVRYNIVYPESRIVPYMQVGAGVVYNDIYKDRDQGVIGQSIEFTFRSGIGIRFFVSDNWSIDVEGAFEHVSNAGMSDRNSGMNAGGGFIGFTYFFHEN
jgi:opacity protein-like surface antigen